MVLASGYRRFFLSKNPSRKKLVFFTRLMAFTEVLVFALLIAVLINFALS
jgi:hypothetical protein